MRLDKHRRVLVVQVGDTAPLQVASQSAHHRMYGWSMTDEDGSSRDNRSFSESFPGLGISVGALAGIAIGVTSAGVSGIALGIGIGAGLGLVAGSIARLWCRRP